MNDLAFLNATLQQMQLEECLISLINYADHTRKGHCKPGEGLLDSLLAEQDAILPEQPLNTPLSRKIAMIKRILQRDTTNHYPILYREQRNGNPNFRQENRSYDETAGGKVEC